MNARHEPRNATNATQWKRFRRGKLVDDNDDGSGSSKKDGEPSSNGGEDLIAVTPEEALEVAPAGLMASSDDMLVGGIEVEQAELGSLDGAESSDGLY